MQGRDFVASKLRGEAQLSGGLARGGFEARLRDTDPLPNGFEEERNFNGNQGVANFHSCDVMSTWMVERGCLEMDGALGKEDELFESDPKYVSFIPGRELGFSSSTPFCGAPEEDTVVGDYESFKEKDKGTEGELLRPLSVVHAEDCFRSSLGGFQIEDGHNRANWISPTIEGAIVAFNKESKEESLLTGCFAKFSLCLGMPIVGFKEDNLNLM